MLPFRYFVRPCTAWTRHIENSRKNVRKIHWNTRYFQTSENHFRIVLETSVRHMYRFVVISSVLDPSLRHQRLALLEKNWDALACTCVWECTTCGIRLTVEMMIGRFEVVFLNEEGKKIETDWRCKVFDE